MIYSTESLNGVRVLREMDVLAVSSAVSIARFIAVLSLNNGS